MRNIKMQQSNVLLIDWGSTSGRLPSIFSNTAKQIVQSPALVSWNDTAQKESRNFSKAKISEVKCSYRLIAIKRCNRFCPANSNMQLILNHHVGSTVSLKCLYWIKINTMVQESEATRTNVVQYITLKRGENNLRKMQKGWMGLCSPSVLLQYISSLLVKKVFNDLPPTALQLLLKSFAYGTKNC